MLLSALLALASAALPVLAMDYHDNYITISLDTANGVQLQDAFFQQEDLFVTPGQDPERRNMIGDSHDGTARYVKGGMYSSDRYEAQFAWSVGRKASSDTANWWMSKFMDSETTFNNHPGSLNFAFYGTLTLTIKNGVFSSSGQSISFRGVGFAQGHDSNGNNWWFGLKNSTQYPDGPNQKIDAVQAYDTTGKYYLTFFRGSDNVNNPTDWAGSDLNAIDELVMKVHSL